MNTHTHTHTHTQPLPIPSPHGVWLVTLVTALCAVWAITYTAVIQRVISLQCCQQATNAPLWQMRTESHISHPKPKQRLYLAHIPLPFSVSSGTFVFTSLTSTETVILMLLVIDCSEFAFANLGRWNSVVMGIHIIDYIMILDHMSLNVRLWVHHIRKIGGISNLSNLYCIINRRKTQV